ncbi:MAG: DUF11 domain-containing protein [Phycisphaerae bacterium]|nr:DUF11 domain-containing protein [Phycisphaerae bacterium]
MAGKHRVSIPSLHTALSVLAVGVAMGTASSFPCLAATHTVGAAACDFTTIQAAIDDAGTAAGDVISVQDAFHTEAGITVNKDVTIQGQGAGSTYVQAHADVASATDRVFLIPAGRTVTIKDLTVYNGNAPDGVDGNPGTAGEDGGGIKNEGTLTLISAKVAACEAGDGGDGNVMMADGGKGGSGGGIYTSGTLTLDDCRISMCETGLGGAGGGGMGMPGARGQGGGIHVAGGTVTINDSMIDNNDAPNNRGGGICQPAGTLTIEDSTIKSNDADDGAGIYAENASASMTNCVINDNTATSMGGGLRWYGNGGGPHSLSLTNCTFTENAAANWGGGVSIVIGGGSPTLNSTMTNCTIYDNALTGNYGGGLVIDNNSGSATLNFAIKNTIVCGNTSAGNGTDVCTWGSAQMTSGDYNLIGDTSSATIVGATTNNIVGQDPKLSALASNGGPTKTCALASDSPAIDPASSNGAPETDQRGYGRCNTTADIGAYEYGGVELPTVTTAAVSDATPMTASSGGDVTSEGGDAVTVRGVCWSTSSAPTTADCKTADGAGSGAFTSSITGLMGDTTYYVRAYATNAGGTAYGQEKSFTTSAPVAPTVTTTAVSNVGSVTADSGGNVTSNGGAVVTARGVCWSTSANPTIADSKTNNGDGSGSFASSITGLTPGQTCHVRAYATNAAGTGYGDDVSFKANAVPPTLTTTAASNVTPTTAQSGGNVTSDGGGTVTARGVCWSTSENPTVADTKTTDGTGAGAFTSSIAGLTAETTYYVRAYAANGAGTAYGNQVTLTTQAAPAEPEPDLSVSVQSQSAEVSVGDEVSFVVSVQNSGDGPATDVVLTIPLPENAEFVSANLITTPTAQSAPTSATVVDGNVVIQVGDVPAGQTVQAELVLRAKTPGSMTVTPSATSQEVTDPVVPEQGTDLDVTDTTDPNATTIAGVTDQPAACCGTAAAPPLLLLSLLFGLRAFIGRSRRR